MSRTDQDKVRRGANAAQILGNPEFEAAFGAVRTRIVSDMEGLDLTLAGSEHAAASLVRDLQAAFKFKRMLVTTVRTGDAEAARIEAAEDDTGTRKDVESPPNW